MPPVDYDHDSGSLMKLDPTYEPKANYPSHEDFIIDIYNNILKEEVDKNSQGVKYWVGELKKGKTPHEIVNHFRKVALEQNQKTNTPDLAELLGDEDKGNRIAVVIPQSVTELLMINALLQNLKNDINNDGSLNKKQKNDQILSLSNIRSAALSVSPEFRSQTRLKLINLIIREIV